MLFTPVYDEKLKDFLIVSNKLFDLFLGYLSAFLI